MYQVKFLEEFRFAKINKFPFFIVFEIGEDKLSSTLFSTQAGILHGSNILSTQKVTHLITCYYKAFVIKADVNNIIVTLSYPHLWQAI
jgi:hypothetical protein